LSSVRIQKSEKTGFKISILRREKSVLARFFLKKMAEGVDVSTSANADLQQNQLI
jgi:hypothetical protein